MCINIHIFVCFCVLFWLMPPELLPRDRKELFRERKNERSLSEGGGSNRWRDVRRPGG